MLQCFIYEVLQHKIDGAIYLPLRTIQHQFDIVSH